MRAVLGIEDNGVQGEIWQTYACGRMDGFAAQNLTSKRAVGVGSTRLV